MNPYFAMAAIFGLGVRGIERKMKLPYGPLGSDGVTRATITHLPTSLESAVEAFKREGSVAREVFGDYFVDHFAGTREHELEEHRRAVTSWEGNSMLIRRLVVLADRQLSVTLSWYKLAVGNDFRINGLNGDVCVMRCGQMHPSMHPSISLHFYIPHPIPRQRPQKQRFPHRSSSYPRPTRQIR